jgi:hypothetical protein
MLEQERAFFDAHREELLQRFPERFALVHGDELVGTFDTMEAALAEGARLFGPTSVLVRRIEAETPEVSVPALTLGLLRADSTRPIRR